MEVGADGSEYAISEIVPVLLWRIFYTGLGAKKTARLAGRYKGTGLDG
jgi:hypothetical protein